MFCTISVLYLTSQILILGSLSYVGDTGQFRLVHAARYMGILLLYRSRIDTGKRVVVFASAKILQGQKLLNELGGKIRRSVACPKKNLYAMHDSYIIIT